MIKKLFNYKINDRQLAILTVIALIVLLLPLCWCAVYAVPYYDDYNFAFSARANSIEYGHSFAWGAYRTMLQEWWAWQGTYSTTFLSAWNPILYGEEYLKYGVIGIIVFFAASVMIFIFTISVRTLQASKTRSFIGGGIVSAALTELIYTAQEGFYWYNAAIHYTFMYGCMLLMLAAVIEIFYRKHIAGKLFLMILATGFGIICAGSNYVIILQGLLLLFTVGGLGVLYRKKDTFFMLIPLAAYIVGFVKNVTAPGNNVRASNFEGCGPIEAILKSFVAAAKHFWELTGLPAMVFILIALPIIWRMVKSTKYSFRMPLLVTVYSLCLYATGYTSSLYAIGTDGVARAWVSVKYTLLLLLFINVAYWLGWFARKTDHLKIMDAISGHSLVYYGAVILFAICVLIVSKDRIRAFSSYGTFYTLYTGEAQSFYQEYTDRIEKIKSGGAVIELQPYTHKPFFLCIDDLSENPYDSKNSYTARWYGKELIYIKNDKID